MKRNSLFHSICVVLLLVCSVVPSLVSANLPPKTEAKWNAFVEKQNKFYKDFPTDDMQPGAVSRYFPASSALEGDCVTVDILFHGFSASPQQYLEWADVLSNSFNHNVLLPLWTGFGWKGDSSKNDGYFRDGVEGLPETKETVKSYVDEVMAVIDHDDAKNKRICAVNVAGLSGGGALALYAPYSESMYGPKSWLPWKKRQRMVKVNMLLAMSPWLAHADKDSVLWGAYLIPKWVAALAKKAGIVDETNDPYGWVYPVKGENDDDGCIRQRREGVARSCNYHVIHAASVNEFGREILSNYGSKKYNDLPEMKVQIAVGENDETVSEDSIRELATHLGSENNKNVQFCALPSFVGHSFFAPRDMTGDKTEKAKQWMGEVNLALVKTLTHGLQKSLEGPACAIRGEQFGSRTCYYCSPDNVMRNYMFYGVDYCDGQADAGMYPRTFKQQGIRNSRKFIPIESTDQDNCCKPGRCLPGNSTRLDKYFEPQLTQCSDEKESIPKPPVLVTVASVIPTYMHNERGAYASVRLSNRLHHEAQTMYPVDEYHEYMPESRRISDKRRMIVKGEISVPPNALGKTINVCARRLDGQTRTLRVNNDGNEFSYKVDDIFSKGYRYLLYSDKTFQVYSSDVKSGRYVQGFKTENEFRKAIESQYRLEEKKQKKTAIVRFVLLMPETGRISELTHSVGLHPFVNSPIQVYGRAVSLGEGNPAYGVFMRRRDSELAQGTVYADVEMNLAKGSDLDDDGNLHFRLYHFNQGVETLVDSQEYRRVKIDESKLHFDDGDMLVIGPLKWSEMQGSVELSIERCVNIVPKDTVLADMTPKFEMQ
eukprot:Nk52_evm6s267 gene=Nk52_evmTU6s267